ncbi:MAG: 50S ribosomal protein L10 [Deltaproteobacteria bacterium]|nr:50S ribosomal protein L10 [Deltaproteobacteria bacterium]
MNRAEKQIQIDGLTAKFNDAEAAFLTDYRGLNVEKITALRGRLREKDTELRVVKNTLARIAAKASGNEALIDYLKGPSALALVYGDPAAAAKVLVDYAKGESNLEVMGGVLSGAYINADAVKRLADLPSKDVMRATLLGAMNAVPGGFVNVLGGVLRSAVLVLNAIKEQKEQLQ